MDRYLANFSISFSPKSIYYHSIFWSLLFCFLPFALSAQELFLTAKYNNNGIANPDYTSDEWKIDALEGSFLYILFRQEKEITDHKLYLFIDKKTVVEKEGESTSNFEGYDNKKIYINKKRNWTAIQYTFLQAGTYKVSIADADKKILVSKEITISYKSKILFSDDLDERSYPLSHQKTFKLEKAKQGIYIFIKDEIPFNSQSLKVIIEKQNKEGNYQNYAEEIFFIDKQLRFSFFNQAFELKGTYRISVFKDNEEVISVGFLKVI